MKRSLAVLLISAFLVSIGAASLSAQATTQPAASPADAGKGSSGAKKDLYVKTFPVMKVYPHSLGYRVDYLTSGGFLATTYLPLSWFGKTAGKGEIVSQVDPAVPYMEIIFDGGKFMMVRLHVMPNYSDRGWGSLGNSVNIDDKFKVDEPALTY